MLLAYEPTGELAEPSPTGVRLLGLDVPRRAGFPAMRHVFDLGEDAGLHVEVDPLGDVRAYAVGYDFAGDEILQAL
ncbi:MAG TPA: hypothetical protein VM582_02275 [Candidatus Thermoplasmatota archaeon]|nr:hypothetical protein [Candidatus Thermoplasmatota archaeon]